jgi:ubiquinone/menaquinone biosynthesis C-methylase UbiE
MDAAHLQFPDESSDCVVLHLVLSVVPDPVVVSVETARVLPLQGRIAV